MNTQAYQFERSQRLHETRNTQGLLNLISPVRWRVFHDDQVNRKSVQLVSGLLQQSEAATVVAIGAGAGGLLQLTWNQPHIKRIGLDINHDVLVKQGQHYFHAVEANACALPLPDASADLVLFDYVLHHLVGQDLLELSIQEANRVLREGGYIVAREPSAFSLSGMAMNMANKFRLMNVLTGSSNYEFAISPPRLIQLFERQGSLVGAHGLSYFWKRRLPIWTQQVFSRIEPSVFCGKRGSWLADFSLYIVRKNFMTRGCKPKPAELIQHV